MFVFVFVCEFVCVCFVLFVGLFCVCFNISSSTIYYEEGTFCMVWMGLSR